jgi:hypothetical protein
MEDIHSFMNKWVVYSSVISGWSDSYSLVQDIRVYEINEKMSLGDIWLAAFGVSGNEKAKRMWQRFKEEKNPSLEWE